MSGGCGGGGGGGGGVSGVGRGRFRALDALDAGDGGQQVAAAAQIVDQHLFQVGLQAGGVVDRRQPQRVHLVVVFGCPQTRSTTIVNF